jgi:hypothetical protein
VRCVAVVWAGPAGRLAQCRRQRARPRPRRRPRRHPAPPSAAVAPAVAAARSRYVRATSIAKHSIAKHSIANFAASARPGLGASGYRWARGDPLPLMAVPAECSEAALWGAAEAEEGEGGGGGCALLGAPPPPPAADVWALGALACELLTGVCPSADSQSWPVVNLGR